jgi:hypothetical protein
VEAGLDSSRSRGILHFSARLVKPQLAGLSPEFVHLIFAVGILGPLLFVNF